MKLLKFALFLILSVFVAGPASAINIPKYYGRVNDFAKIFSSDFTKNLEKKLLQIESQTTDQIVVVTVNNLQETTIEDYANQLFNYWKIGQKDKDNGILLIISTEDRNVRLEVGYGLESVITDGRAGEIIRNQIIPAFKKGDYEAGVLAGIDKISQYLTNQTSENTVRKNTKINGGNLFSISVYLVIIFFSYIFSFMARSKSFYAGGIGGSILGFIVGFFSSITNALILSIIIGFIGLLLDFILSKNYQRLKKLGKSTKFWDSSGGFGGGSSGGGGGFGGGSSGGGGASGSW